MTNTATEEIKRLAEIVKNHVSVHSNPTLLYEDLAKVILESGYLPSSALVRPLVWEDAYVADFKAVTPVTTYFVSKGLDGIWNWRCRLNGADIEEWHNTEDEAKQAAQNHFNTLIGSCLQRPKPLLYADIKEGMTVIDSDGDVGTVKDCSDPHNVAVEYEHGGSGMHCLHEGCDEFGKSHLYPYCCLQGGGYTEEQVIGFAEWLKEMHPELEVKNGQWVIESQITSENLLKAYMGKRSLKQQ